jgi:hypothetical protein
LSEADEAVHSDVSDAPPVAASPAAQSQAELANDALAATDESAASAGYSDTGDATSVAASPAAQSQPELADDIVVATDTGAAGTGVETIAADAQSIEIPDQEAGVAIAVPEPVYESDNTKVAKSGDAEIVSASEAAATNVAADLTAQSTNQTEEAELPDVSDLPLIDPCTQYKPEDDTWLDYSQLAIYRTVCGATAWFDGFFGDRRYDQATGETFGRISIGGYWDEYSGFDSRLRFRARFALPSLRERGSVLIGRGDDQTIIEERDTAGTDQIPVQPSPDQDQQVSTFVGFGWNGLASLSRSLDFSAGLKLRSKPIPIFKIKYRRAWQMTDRDVLSIRPLLYWRSDQGLGFTLQQDFDHVLNNAFLFRWANYGNISEDEEVQGVRWGSTFYLYQALSQKKALTYSIFASGETDAPVSFQNVGLELRYRHSFLRKWLFIEYYGGVGWPRYQLEEKREINPGIGLRLEAYFGPAPDSWMR